MKLLTLNELLAEIQADEWLRNWKQEKENNLRLAANWTGLYLYPGLREKKEGA
jgi:hypothetical protein